MAESLYDVLTNKFGKVKQVDNFYYFKCPTCMPKVRYKRFISVKGGTSGCWCCEQKISLDQLLGEHFVVQELGPDIIAEYDNPYATIYPYTMAYRLDELLEDHPAIQHLAKDQLYDYTRYTDEFGILYIEEGIHIPSKEGNKSWQLKDVLFFPFMDDGNLLGWQARFLNPRKDFRYYTCANKSKLFWGEPQCRNKRMVILVEGVKKALKFDNAMACLGKGISDFQIQRLQEWKQIVIMLDSEPETQQLANNITNMIAANGKKIINVNVGDYGFHSPDEADSLTLQRIVYTEWSKKYG